jgi:hypothetical protein
MRLSKKLVVTVGTSVVNVLIALEVIPMDIKKEVIGLITALAAMYIFIQGSIDKEDVKLKAKEVE